MMIASTVRQVDASTDVISATSATTTVAGNRIVNLNLIPSAAPIAHASSAAIIGIDTLPLPPCPARLCDPFAALNDVAAVSFLDAESPHQRSKKLPHQ
jgi:hypothetical protein